MSRNRPGGVGTRDPGRRMAAPPPHQPDTRFPGPASCVWLRGPPRWSVWPTNPTAHLALCPRGCSHPHPSPHQRSPTLLPRVGGCASALSLTSIPRLWGGGTGLPCWGVQLAAGSPSTYPARLLTGRRSTCFLTTLSPTGTDRTVSQGRGTQQGRAWQKASGA